MNHEFMDALEQLEREKGISKEILLDAIETALASAYKRDQKAAQSIEVKIDPANGAFHVFTHRTVVEEVEDDKNEISLSEAQKINVIYELGDLVEFEIFPKEFGRIAAQTAKQVVVQRIREAERSMIYEEFSNRMGDLITGIIQRHEQKNIFIDLGRIEGILPGNEQIPNEQYEMGTRLKTFVVEVKKTTKGPQVLLSRTRNGLLKRLFELEVPEIQDGLVEIKSVAREPGYRSKVAVYSRDPQVDPVGSCVGAKGIRVQMIVRELKGEKIDLVPWSAEPVEFIVNALSPSKVTEVKILPSKKMAVVIVPDFQLSLAIGREGQNARLAAKLTGWKIDIKSESQAAEQAKEIERLLGEEFGLKGILPVPEKLVAVIEDKSTLLEVESLDEQGDQLEEELLETEVFEAEEEAFPPKLESEELEENENKKTTNNKKVKKSKTTPKHRRQVLDEELVSTDEGYFFVDVLSERAKLDSESINSETKVVTIEKNQDDNGFTIGQLLKNETEKTKSKKKEKGDD